MYAKTAKEEPTGNHTFLALRSNKNVHKLDLQEGDIGHVFQ